MQIVEEVVHVHHQQPMAAWLSSNQRMKAVNWILDLHHTCLLNKVILEARKSCSAVLCERVSLYLCVYM